MRKSNPVEVNLTQSQFYPLLKNIVDKTGGFIAGGCFKDILQNKTPRDLDVYFRNPGDFENARDIFYREYEFLYENINCIAFKVPYDIQMVIGDPFTSQVSLTIDGEITVELIKCIFGPPLDVLNTFDFSISKMWFEKGFKHIEGSKYRFMMDSEGKRDFENKKLTICNDRNPIGTARRILKYARYGFHMDEKDLPALLTGLVKQVNDEVTKNGGYFNFKNYRKILSLHSSRYNYHPY